MAMEIKEMSTDHIMTCLAIFDMAAKECRDHQRIMRAHGMEETLITMYSIPTKSYEYADRMEEELNRRGAA